VDIPNGKKYVVWVRIAKTGSTSTENTLISLESLIKYKDVLNKPDSFDSKKQIIRVVDLDQLKNINIDVEDCFIFTVVRNPYRRALSGWFFHGWFREKDNFTQALKKPPQKHENEGAWRHFTKTMTQHLLYNNQIRVDHVIKLENYDEEFSKFLQEQLGFLKSDFILLKKNISNSNNKKISREELDMMNKIFKNDFENFDYLMQ